MDKKQVIKKLEEIQKQVNYLIKQMKGFEQEDVSPFSQAVKIATAKNSTDEEVKKALEVFGQSPQALTVNQAAFVLFFLALNKPTLSEEVNWFFGLEVGKHKYNQRDSFIDAIGKVLEDKYSSNMTLVNGLKMYLGNFKKK